MRIVNRSKATIARGTIVEKISKSMVKVSIDSSRTEVDALYYPSYFGIEGHFIGGAPQVGTPVAVEQGDGGVYYIIALIANPNVVPTIVGRSLLIQSDSSSRINLDPDNFISVGSGFRQLRVDPNRDVISTNFASNYSFTEAGISIEGIVKRDLFPNRNDNLARRDSHDFEDSLRTIAFDPSLSPNLTTSDNLVRNPAFVEKREITYEFAHTYGFSSDQEEIDLTQDVKNKSQEVFYNRREARTDVLSLTQLAQNYLIESVKGTVIDIYGNVLDLNRNILPAGRDKKYSFIDSQDKQKTFLALREIERRSIAYHFEINTRKGRPGINGEPKIVPPPAIESRDNWARDRSRFFFDVDKEGQFKLNIPASSEKGNVPLQVRAENFSTVEGIEKGINPNLFSFNAQSPENKDQRRDIYLDTVAFNGGTVSIVDPENSGGYSVPIDRISKKAIKHGTIYHDITEILAAHRSPPKFEFEPINTNISLLEYPVRYVSNEIKISGPEANAGGRSGSLNFDGSIELNVGANTVDKQSIWLDTHGSVVGAIGRDKNHVSMGLTMTGDLLLEVGGSDVGMSPTNGVGNREIADSRFLGNSWGQRAGAVDIRVYQKNGEYAVIRVDEMGISLLTPTNISIVAGKALQLKGSQVAIDAEEIILYSNDPGARRVVSRNGLTVA